MEVKQLNENEISVTFGYQIQKDIRLDDLMIGASPEGCGPGIRAYSVQYNPIELKDSRSGVVTADDAIKVRLYKPGTCDAKKISLYVFRNNAPSIYKAIFDASFTLEMK